MSIGQFEIGSHIVKLIQVNVFLFSLTFNILNGER